MTGPSLTEASRVFGRIGLLSFGGPAAQIALMHRELVDERNWLSEKQFLSALSFCMLLPGPEAMQLATYAGWRLHGTLGGIIAGLLFVIPGALVILALSLLYAFFGDVPLVEAVFLGVKAAVVIIVIEALLRVSKKALKGIAHWVIAGLAFLAIYALGLPFPLIILLAGIYGFATTQGEAEAPPKRVAAKPMQTIAIWLTLWLTPIFALWAVGASFLTDIAIFFSKLAVVTFGGAYAVLAYMTQAAVFDKEWLTTPQMVDGLGLAETTPGPLILVTEFVGFLAGFAQGGVLLALATALTTLWVTFIPCFLWIFLGAPYLEWIRTRPRLSGALSAITAAVVGVILNLSVWFAMHVFFDGTQNVTLGPVSLLLPMWASVQWIAIALSTIAGALLLKLHWGLPRVLAIMATLGIVIGVL